MSSKNGAAGVVASRERGPFSSSSSKDSAAKGHNPHNTTPSSSVQVVVRLRPLNEREKKHGTLPVVSASTNDKTVTVIKGSGSRQVKTSYKFDHVFTAFSTQEEVFQATLQPVIRDVLMGFESTVFAYGQTGTGKTHTMEGDLSHPDLHGVIPRSAAAIFQALEHPHYLEKNLSVSFLEIYNEDLCDLLADTTTMTTTTGTASAKIMKPTTTTTKLDIMEGKNGPFCRGLSETQVSSTEEVLALMRKAQKCRQVGETNMNLQSSRSHCIFTLKVQAKRKVGDGSVLEVSGKLHCVDLAGSECAKSADLDDDQQASRERERMNINRSLLTLGRVVSMLKEQSQGSSSNNNKTTNKHMRIPYRDSKLTRILQESLGGRCKTCLIATVSPSVSAIEESMSTLNYAQTANGIINKPVISSLMMTTDGSAAALTGAKNSSGGETGTIEHWHEMEVRLQYMQSQVEEAQQALARKHLQQQELTERAEAAEAAQVAAVAELEEVQQEKVLLEQQIEQHISEKEQIKNKLELTEHTLKETLTILKATRDTEKKLTTEARDLLALLRKSTQDGDDMHAKLLRNHQDDVARKQATKAFHATLLTLLNKTTDGLDSILQTNMDQSSVLKDSTLEHVNSQQAQIQTVTQIVQALSTTIAEAATSLTHLVDDEMVKRVATYTANIANTGLSLQTSNSNHRTLMLPCCGNLREALHQARNVLESRELEYQESSTIVLGSLGAHVEESKNHLSVMMSSVSEAMTRGRNERKETYQVLVELVNKWRTTTVTAARGMGETSAIEGDNVKALFDLLEMESSRHAEVQRILDDQCVFLNEQRAKHLSQLQMQNKNLAVQRHAFEKSEQQANELCNRVMTNILSGVQQLVKNEISSISEYHQRSTGDFVHSNEGLVTSNREIVDSFTAAFQHLEGNTTGLQSHAIELRSKDESTCQGLLKTQQSLLRLRGDSSQLEQTVQASFELISQRMVDADENDQCRIGVLNDSITQQNTEFGDHLQRNVSEQVVPRVKGLSDSLTEIVAFTKSDVIDHTSTCLHDDIEAHIVKATNTSEQLIGKILTESAQYEQSVKRFATAHTGMVGDLTKASSHRVDESCAAFVTQSASCEEFKAHVLGKFKSNETALAKQIGNESVRTSNVKQSVDVFAQTVIEMNSEPVSVDARNVFTFNEELSSTPPDHIILESLSSRTDMVSLGGQGTASTVAAFDHEATENMEGDPMNATIPSSMTLPLRETTNAVQSSAREEPGQVSKRRTASIQDMASTKRVRTGR